MLVETATVSVSGLSPERPSDEAGTKPVEPMAFDEEPRELVGQLINFRLAPGCGVVGRVFELSVGDPGCALSQFQLRKTGLSDLWSWPRRNPRAHWPVTVERGASGQEADVARPQEERRHPATGSDPRADQDAGSPADPSEWTRARRTSVHPT